MDITNSQADKESSNMDKLQTDFLNKINVFKNELNEFGKKINLLKREHSNVQNGIKQGLTDLEKVYEELASIEKYLINNLVEINHNPKP